jgi:hemerythrin-like domain-containing protein
MNKLFEYLRDGHRDCDALMAAAERAVLKRDWPAAELCFTEFSDETLRHFSAEEGILFPAFEHISGNVNGPSYAMRTEHHVIRDLLTLLSRALRAKNADDFLGRADTLNIMLQQHNLKEESILYPIIVRALHDGGDDVLESIRRLECTTAP